MPSDGTADPRKKLGKVGFKNRLRGERVQGRLGKGRGRAGRARSLPRALAGSQGVKKPAGSEGEKEAGEIAEKRHPWVPVS